MCSNIQQFFSIFLHVDGRTSPVILFLLSSVDVTYFDCFFFV